MSWTSITNAMVQARLSQQELEALQHDEVAVGQADPLTQILEQVTNEVRGYVAAAERWTLGAAGTVPPALVNCAINRIRFEVATRFPRAAILDEDRRKANETAIALLEAVAEGKFAFESAAGVGATRGIQVATYSTRSYSRTTLDGL